MIHPTQFIPVAQKCIEMYAKDFGGLARRETLLVMLPNVMFVVALRPNTKELLVLFNLCLFPSENGTKSVWTSSLAFRKPRKETMPSLLSSIDSQKLLTSFEFVSLFLLVS